MRGDCGGVMMMLNVGGNRNSLEIFLSMKTNIMENKTIISRIQRI